MEDVLDTYELPYDPLIPVIGFDECSKQLVDHVRKHLPPLPGKPSRIDDEYRRCGTGNLFAAIEPLTGRVVLEVTPRRGAVECAHFLRRIADEEYPNALLIKVVCDNLNTHNPGSFYEAFAPQEAHCLKQRFEWHYTPKHGSWLNVAECLLSIIARQCLAQRIASLERLRELVEAWEANRPTSVVRWQFTTDDARVKLRRLYPNIQQP
jgi:hypothetical protein